MPMVGAAGSDLSGPRNRSAAAYLAGTILFDRATSMSYLPFSTTYSSRRHRRAGYLGPPGWFAVLAFVAIVTGAVLAFVI